MLIATRTLLLRDNDIDHDVVIGVFAPVPDRDGGWSCTYEIGWPDRKRTMTAGGVDAVQALLSALQMIGAELYASDHHKAGSLRFETPGRGYGFPVPGNARDLLEGDDAKYL
jgi:hypothetical protein